MAVHKPIDEGCALLFINRAWFSNKKAPKIGGKVKINGVEYQLQLWEFFGGTSKTPYYSGKITELNQYIKMATQESLARKKERVEAVEEDNKKLEEARNCWKKEN